MKDGYLSKYSKKNSQILPYIHKKIKPIDSTLSKLKQPTEQSLLLQLQDIDQTLHNKNFVIRNGLLFSSEISDKLVSQLYSCLKKQAMIMEQGFSLWNHGVLQQNGCASKQDRRLSNKLETLNERIVKLSLQNVYDYDLKKYIQIMKMNKNKWSLFKKVQKQTPSSISTRSPQKLEIKKIEQSIQKQTHKRNSNHSVTSSMTNSKTINNTSLAYTNLSPRLPQQVSKMSRISKMSESQHVQLNPMRDHTGKRKVLTQIEQFHNPQQQNLQISKYDIKNMLRKQSSNLIFIWLPPATYPQFHGMFNYATTKKLQICRLKKYFFFRRGLSKRFFISIMDQISTRQCQYIEGIQLVSNKTDYGKIYEPLGWKMKSVEGFDKIRIGFYRNQG